MAEKMENFTVRMPRSLRRVMESNARHLVPGDSEPSVAEAIRTACVEHVKRSIPPKPVGREASGSPAM